MTANIVLRFKNAHFQLKDPQTPHSIAIKQTFTEKQPNHFSARFAEKKPMQSNGFIGDVAQGGSCNAYEILLNPHCNGTHTETVSHVLQTKIAPHQVVSSALMLAFLITIDPQLPNEQDSYSPTLMKNEKIIGFHQIKKKLEQLPNNVQALIIRTKPNTKNKKHHNYQTSGEYAYFSHQAMQLISDIDGLQHLLVDTPSVDRMHDEGKLSNHRIFWNIKTDDLHYKNIRNKRTITEMVYVPDTIVDGLYALNLQVPAMQLDAVPSNPTLFEIIKS